MARPTYSTASRDRYRTAVTVGTGLGVVGALAGSGLLAGAAAARFEAEGSADQAAQPVDAPRTRAARRDDRPLRERPIRTRVTVRYVSAVGSTTVGAGGTVTRVDSGSSGSGGSGGSGGGGSSSGPGPAPAPPPEPPTPTSGS